MGACVCCRRNRLVLMGLATPVGDLICGAEYIFRLCATTAAGPSAHVLSPTIKMTLVPPMPPREPQVHFPLPSARSPPLPAFPLPSLPFVHRLRCGRGLGLRATSCGTLRCTTQPAQPMDSLHFTLQLEVGEGGDHLRLLLRMEDWAEAAITDVHVECAAAALCCSPLQRRICPLLRCPIATAAHAK